MMTYDNALTQTNCVEDNDIVVIKDDYRPSRDDGLLMPARKGQKPPTCDISMRRRTELL